MKMFPRAAAVLAAALVGLTGLVGFSPPASAAAASPCTTLENAKYQHTFNGPAGTAGIKLTNGPLCAGLHQTFTLVSYTAPSTQFALPQYLLDTSVQRFTAPAGDQKAAGELTFKVEVPQCYTQVDFIFGNETISPMTETSGRYNDRKVGSPGSPGNRSTAVKGSPQNAWYNGGRSTCVSRPAAVAIPDCDGNVMLTLINRGTRSEEFVVTADGGYSDTRKLGAGVEPVSFRVASADAKNIVVKSGGTVLWKGNWTKPADCQDPDAAKPSGTGKNDCDGLTFTVKNPQNGTVFSATFTPNKGAAQTITTQPGETKTVAFPAAEGLTVAVSGGLGLLSEEAIAWTKPMGCTTPTTPATTTPAGTPPATPSATPSRTASASPSPVPGKGGGTPGKELPLTGSAAMGLTAAAFLLIVAGAALYIVARRRRVNFNPR